MTPRFPPVSVFSIRDAEEDTKTEHLHLSNKTSVRTSSVKRLQVWRYTSTYFPSASLNNPSAALLVYLSYVAKNSFWNILLMKLEGKYDANSSNTICFPTWQTASWCFAHAVRGRRLICLQMITFCCILFFTVFVLNGRGGINEPTGFTQLLIALTYMHDGEAKQTKSIELFPQLLRRHSGPSSSASLTRIKSVLTPWNHPKTPSRQDDVWPKLRPINKIELLGL